MVEVTLYFNLDPKQAQTLRARTAENLLIKVERLLADPDACGSIAVGDPSAWSNTWTDEYAAAYSLYYARPYMNWEIHYWNMGQGHDQETGLSFEDAATRFLEHVKQFVKVAQP